MQAGVVGTDVFCHVIVCCSSSETYGGKWGDSNFQFFVELLVPPQAGGVVGTLNACFVYINLSTTVSFLDIN